MASRADQFVNKRREPRLAANLSAELLSYRQRRAVRIVDVSRNGAMVRGDDLPERGDEVVLRHGSFEVVATVAWSIEQHCGLALHRPIDPHALLRAATA